MRAVGFAVAVVLAAAESNAQFEAATVKRNQAGTVFMGVRQLSH